MKRKRSWGGKRRRSGRPPRGKEPTVRKTFSLTPAALARLESFRFDGESSSAALDRVLLSHHQIVREPKASP